MADQLKGKTIAVYGAYGFVGSILVQRAVLQGANVIAVGRDQSKLDALAQDIGTDIQTRSVDLAQNRQGGPLFGTGETLDAIFTPLGGAYVSGAFADLEPSDFANAMEGKLLTQVAALQASLPHLAEKGSVLLFSGLFSRKPMDGFSAMTALNGAIEALTPAIAIELAPLRVNCIAPALIKPSADRRSTEASVTTPEEVADLALSVAQLNVSGSVFDIPRDPSVL
ncbi:SDR family oxidoreductase [Roseobacter weihaiensis]|uniref:SDR family oxidoreductase n=1 Tax=Roseobacter weihaiensis TaxID=2763262 RepID=UPI001D0B00BC|nr:SDR family oxidoreductase [Roseobacter sp. H9]